jgi:hypothetical protein
MNFSELEDKLIKFGDSPSTCFRRGWEARQCEVDALHERIKELEVNKLLQLKHVDNYVSSLNDTYKG